MAIGRPKGSKNGHPTLVDVTCRRCGKVFSVKPSQAPLKRYCSKACQDGPSLAVACASCGVAMTIKPSRGTGNHYCGRDCKTEGHRRWSAVNRTSGKPEREVLRRLYEDERLGTRTIGDRYEVSHMTVKRWLKADAIAARPTGRGLVNRGIREPTADELRQMVQDEDRSFDEIATLFSVDPSAVGHWLAKHGIDAGPNRWRTERLVCDDGDQVRSYYELRVDNWLSAHGLAHTYEPTVPFSRRSRADFLVSGWYVEIWGVTGSAVYDARKAIKRSLYTRHGLPLLELEAADFPRLWEQRLCHCLTPVPKQP